MTRVGRNGFVPFTVAVALAAASLAAPGFTSSAGAASCRSLSALSLSTTTVTATAPVTATLRMRCRAGTRVVVRLTGTAGVRVPASVTVRKGRTSVAFRIRTLPTATNRRDVVRASFGASHRSAALAVRTGCASRLGSFTAPTGLYAGEKADGSVTLACAPRSDVVVSLSSDDPVTNVPSHVVVHAGHRSAVVPVTATQDYSSQHEGRVTARYAGAAATRTLTITPGIKVFEVSPSSDPNSGYLDVGLTGPAPPGGLSIAVSSDDPAFAPPATIVVPQNSLGVGVNADVQPVAVDTTVTLTAKLGRRAVLATTRLLRPWNAATDGATLSTQDDLFYGLRQYKQFDLRIDHPAGEGGVPVVWHVRDDDPALVLQGSSDDAVLAGSTSTSTFFSAADVTQTTTVYLDATVGTKTVSLAVTIEPRMVAVNLPSSVTAGSDFTGTIQLAGPSTTPQTVHLQTSWSVADVEESVVIPANQTSVTFHGTTTSDVSEPSDIFVTAYRGDGSEPESVGSGAMTITP